MSSNHVIRFRVNKEQLEKIKLEAVNNGYLTTSAYIRDIALNRNTVCLEFKISELSKEIKELKEAFCNG
jgi:hypothetical protein